jgi:hypothetical protein
LRDDSVGGRGAVRAAARTGNGSGHQAINGLNLECVFLAAAALYLDWNHRLGHWAKNALDDRENQEFIEQNSLNEGGVGRQTGTLNRESAFAESCVATG